MASMDIQHTPPPHVSRNTQDICTLEHAPADGRKKEKCTHKRIDEVMVFLNQSRRRRSSCRQQQPSPIATPRAEPRTNRTASVHAPIMYVKCAVLRTETRKTMRHRLCAAYCQAKTTIHSTTTHTSSSRMLFGAHGQISN